MARISTHVLDIAKGRPAEGVRIDFYFLRGACRELIRSTATNAGGRTSEPLLSGDRIATGVYEIDFHAGDYFHEQGDPPFLDVVTIRFGVSDPQGHYHVPLLVAPHGYSTYRGS